MNATKLRRISAYALLLLPLLEVCGAPLIVDHSSVELSAQIPQEYINKVKEMWADIPGESHSLGYRKGCLLLQTLDERFKVKVQDAGTPEGYTNAYMRISRATWGLYGWNYWGYGEADWYTSTLGVERVKGTLVRGNTNNLELAAMGFGWCWDATWHNPPGGTVDPVFQVRWAGSSEGGPDGDLRWGLDAEDTVLTGNRICLDTYLNATQQYDDFCKSNGFKTRVFFTTGAIDGSSGESGYQRHLKYERIRDYVRQSSDGILFDYADILSWNENGAQNLETWTDFGGMARSYQIIHPDNMVDLNGGYTEDGDHIGERGAVRLGKALWYMLARMAGWDGIPRHTLTVNSLYGGTEPGTLTTNDNTMLEQWVTNSPVFVGVGTQDVCVGGSVESNDFTQVSATNVTLTLTNDAMLTWQWETQYLLTTATNGNGSVTAADGWHTADSSTTLTATAATYWHFTRWSGDTQDCDVADNVITATMTQARTLVAGFAENLAPLGTPELWLSQHGLTNDLPDKEETKDTDEDGMFAWQEYVASTDPTNKASVLSITGVTCDGNSTRVDWTGGEWARQYIQIRQSLAATGELWTSIHTNKNLPTPITNCLTNNAGTSDASFYRIKVER